MLPRTITTASPNDEYSVTHQHSGDFCPACDLEKWRQKAAMLVWVRERNRTELDHDESRSVTVEIEVVSPICTTGLPDTRPGDPMVNAVAESDVGRADA